jgi:FixJ family two-component response regulator
MSNPKMRVFIVDDDYSIRVATERLLSSVGHDVYAFESAEEFLERAARDAAACLVLDIRLPDASGLDLQHELASWHPQLPIIFITGYADVPQTIRAMKNGAAAFLAKPFDDCELIDAVDHALKAADVAWRESAELKMLRARLQALTARERQVYELVVSGLPNKLIAAELGIREATTKIHRGQVMHKTGARSIAELVRISERMGTLAEKHGRSACAAAGTR